MSVVAFFTYEIAPGRLNDFLAKLQRAGIRRSSPARSCRPGSGCFAVHRPRARTPARCSLCIEYPDMAAYGARTCMWSRPIPAWRELFAAPPGLARAAGQSVQLLTEFVP